MSRLFLRSSLASLLLTIVCQQLPAQSSDGLVIRSQRTQTIRPWTFWYWMYGCVSDEGIRLDLQAMKEAGIDGFYLMPIKDPSDGEQYGGEARQLSAEWWKRMDTVFHLADSLHLNIGIHLSDGFALGGGPWISPEESMQKVVWTDTIVEGGNIPIALAQPEAFQGYYEDIGVYAFPLQEKGLRSLKSLKSLKTLKSIKPTSSVEFPYRSTEPCEVVLSYERPFTMRHVRIVTGGNNYQAHRWKVFASDDGEHYRHVRDIEPARQGWQNTDAQATYAIPTTTARYFKFCWTPEGSDPGSEDMDAAKWRPVLKVADIQPGSHAVIDGYEGKSGLVWRVSKAFPIDSADCLPMPLMLPAGESATLPPGVWRVLRMGHTSTGHTNATGGGGRGLECDKFSRKAIRKQLINWFDTIFYHNNAKGITRLHVDSWECGSQNWGAHFAQEFHQRRGYDLLPWLPIYAGVPMVSSERTEEVLRDIRQTIADLVDEVFYDEMEQAAKDYGVKLSAECVAPTMVSDGLLHYRHADYPMGEFWLRSPTHDKPNDMLDAISGAHIYGKNIVQAEGFTEVRGTWDETPATLKPLLDRNWCLGVNSIVFHVNTHNPWPDRKPGMTLDGIGTFFQRDNTWWPEMPAFTHYITETQRLLQRGEPVVDLAVYIGDEVPRRAILPERLTTILPGLMGDSLLQRAALREANAGVPLETSPVGVTHTLNMTKADDWTNPLHGYKYDSFNHDVLRSMRVEDGMVVTRNGMRYAAIVVPGARKMNPDNINTGREEIEALKQQGAKVIESPWTEGDLIALGIAPDIVLPEGVDYTHRHTDVADYYFFSNLTERTVAFPTQCREARKYFYLQDTMHDCLTPAGDTITLAPHASVFLVTTDNEYHLKKITPPEETLCRKQQFTRVAEVTGDWQVTLEENGTTFSTDLSQGLEAHEDPKIKYFSGHASYENTFKYKGKGRVWLHMEEVHDIATVYVNGVCCGTSWLPPHRVDITDAVKRGNNHLRIVVANTWANALLGADNGTPPYDGIWTNAKYRRAEKTLLPAGLRKGVYVEK